MPTHLRYVDPNRPRSSFSRAYAAFGSTRLGKFISRHVFWKLDPFLLRATRGRLSMALVIPTALLETRGAKSGAVRRNAAIYFHDEDRVTIVASNAGYARHPAWYHNLRAHPDVTFGGIPMRATVVSDEAECQRIWTLADRVFPPYAKFRRDAAKANRTIPIVQLMARE
jgi:deazaflavin-dependent oxidoreductase (nitroreductase family)